MPNRRGLLGLLLLFSGISALADPRHEELLRQFEVIKDQISDIRGLRASGPVAMDILTPEAAIAFDNNEYGVHLESIYRPGDGAMTIERNRETLLWMNEISATGLLRLSQANPLIRGALALTPHSVHSHVFSVVAASYYWRPRQFVVIDDGRERVRNLVFYMAHEWVHALQNVHFDLEAVTSVRRIRYTQRNSDAEQAATALIEGDAQFTRALWVNNFNPRRPEHRGFIESMMSNYDQEVATGINLLGELTESPTAVTRALRGHSALLNSSYIYGQALAHELYRRGGWSALNRAFGRPPASMEQVMHPRKYFSDEMPVELALPEAALSLRQSSFADYDLIFSDSAGEMGILAALLTMQQPEEIATEERIFAALNVGGVFGELRQAYENIAAIRARKTSAAAGWNGDRYWFFRNGRDTRNMIMLWSTRWDSSADAQEFARAYEELIRIKQSAMPGVYMSVELLDREVRIVEGGEANMTDDFDVMFASVQAQETRRGRRATQPARRTRSARPHRH